MLRALLACLLIAPSTTAAPVPRHLFDSDLIPGYRFALDDDRTAVIAYSDAGRYQLIIEEPCWLKDQAGYTYRAVDYRLGATATSEYIRETQRQKQ